MRVAAVGVLVLVAEFFVLNTGGRADAFCRRERFVPSGSLSLWPPGTICSYGEPEIREHMVNSWFVMAAIVTFMAFGLFLSLRTRAV